MSYLTISLFVVLVQSPVLVVLVMYSRMLSSSPVVLAQSHLVESPVPSCSYLLFSYSHALFSRTIESPVPSYSHMLSSYSRILFS
jgi:hypothetical protein